MSTTYENACFSNAAYGGQGSTIPSGWQEVTSVGGYSIAGLLTNPDNGFQAKVFQSGAGEIVIAYAGSNEMIDWTKSNMQIANKELPAQYENAKALFAAVKANTNADITLTGHSLGGALAELVTVRQPDQSSVRAEVFNPPGVGDLVHLINPEYDKNCRWNNIICNMDVGDPVSKFGTQITSGMNYYERTGWESSFSGLPLLIQPVSFLTASAYLGFRSHTMDHILSHVTEISSPFTTAQKFTPRRDPLTLDLDGDGIETVAASATNPILFDHDGDGVKTGTGWVSADDGFLVLDRNGNGSIDNGTELFGEATPLDAGGKAADGFAALRQEDTNSDGKVNNLDTNWANLRVWRDLNQDGLSQEEELLTMSQGGIAEFNVANTSNNQVLQNGNQIADIGNYTRTDGSLGTMGDVGQMADVNLVDDTFHREFSDTIPLAEGVADLPEMQGSGKLRDLHEAASQSTGLKDLLTQYSQATTRQGQRALLDPLLDAWADTSGIYETLDDRNPDEYHVRYDSIGTVRRSNNLLGPEGGDYVRDVDINIITCYPIRKDTVQQGTIKYL